MLPQWDWSCSSLLHLTSNRATSQLHCSSGADPHRKKSHRESTQRRRRASVQMWNELHAAGACIPQLFRPPPESNHNRQVRRRRRQQLPPLSIRQPGFLRCFPPHISPSECVCFNGGQVFLRRKVRNRAALWMLPSFPLIFFFFFFLIRYVLTSDRLSDEWWWEQDRLPDISPLTHTHTRPHSLSKPCRKSSNLFIQTKSSVM